MADCPGFDALIKFCARNEITQAALARGVGVMPPVAHEWLTRARRPSRLFQQALARWSNGEIPETAWETAVEKKRLSSVRPFDGPTKQTKRPRKSTAA